MWQVPLIAVETAANVEMKEKISILLGVADSCSSEDGTNY